MTNKIFLSLKVVALAIVLSFGLSYVYAWTAPTATPPTGNVSAPLNTSGTAQTKNGGLTVSSITAPSHCIGTSCITTWPTPPVGSSFLDTSGTGQTKTGTLTTGTLTINGGLILNNGTITASGAANSSYSSLTVNGSKNGWAGINFPGAGTLMMNSSYSGFYNATDNNWRMYVTDGGATGLGRIYVAGISGIGYEIVTNSATSNGHFTVDVSCSAGKSILGGGCNQQAGGNRALVDDNPAGATGWHCRGRDVDNSQTVTLTAYAICARVQ